MHKSGNRNGFSYPFYFAINSENANVSQFTPKQIRTSWIRFHYVRWSTTGKPPLHVYAGQGIQILTAFATCTGVRRRPLRNMRHRTVESSSSSSSSVLVTNEIDILFLKELRDRTVYTRNGIYLIDCDWGSALPPLLGTVPFFVHRVQ